MSKFAAHGSRTRVRLGCSCLACSRRLGAVAADWDLRWSFAPLQRLIGPDTLRDWFGDEQCRLWRKDGLSDEEADLVSVTLGYLPYAIWDGYIEHGLELEEGAHGLV